jgi:hypothetical protein
MENKETDKENQNHETTHGEEEVPPSLKPRWESRRETIKQESAYLILRPIADGSGLLTREITDQGPCY